MTIAELQNLAKRKGLVIHAAALGVTLTDVNRKTVRVGGQEKITVEEAEAYLNTLSDAPIKVTITESQDLSKMPAEVQRRSEKTRKR